MIEDDGWRRWLEKMIEDDGWRKWLKMTITDNDLWFVIVKMNQNSLIDIDDVL